MGERNLTYGWNIRRNFTSFVCEHKPGSVCYPATSGSRSAETIHDEITGIGIAHCAYSKARILATNYT